MVGVDVAAAVVVEGAVGVGVDVAATVAVAEEEEEESVVEVAMILVGGGVLVEANAAERGREGARDSSRWGIPSI